MSCIRHRTASLRMSVSSSTILVSFRSFVCPPVRPSIHLHPSIRPSACPSVRPSMDLRNHPSVFRYVRASVRPSVHARPSCRPSVHQSTPVRVDRLVVGASVSRVCHASKQDRESIIASLAVVEDSFIYYPSAGQTSTPLPYTVGRQADGRTDGRT